LDGVLGGYGSSSLPRIDALGSRQFLLYLLPELAAIPSSIRPLSPPQIQHRVRALDVGAGIGRVTSTVLLHLVQDVLLLEPVVNFIDEAYTAGLASAGGDVDRQGVRWRGIKECTNSVTFLQGTLQSFDPTQPLSSTNYIGRVGYTSPSSTSDLDAPLDIAWCQWCLGHLSDPDLISFLRKCKNALREGGRSLIVVKENLCRDLQDENGEAISPRTIFDEQDSSLTRSDLAWKEAFKEAGLTLVKEQIQRGLPEELYKVKMYALR